MDRSLFQKKLVDLQKNMLNFALSLTSNRDEAEELTQETTLKVLDNQEKFTDNTNFKGWVLTIMKNLFINNYRQVVRNHTIFDTSSNLYNLQTENHSDFGSPEQLFNLQDINGAIDSLNSDLRESFTLYLIGFKYNEIAEKLNLPLGTVKSRIFFARQELQRQLRELVS